MEQKRRQKQLGQVLKRSISEFLNVHLHGAGSGLATVIDVIVTPNLAKIEIWISSIGCDVNQLKNDLNALLPEIRQVIHRHLHLRKPVFIEFKVAG